MRTSSFSLCGGDCVTRRWQCAPILKPKIQLITLIVAFLLIYPALCWTPSIWPQLHKARGCWQSLQRHQGVSGMSPPPSISRGQGFQTLLATQGVNIQSRESGKNASSDKEGTPVDAEEPSHIRQLREELESILRNGDKMLTSSAIHSLHAQQPAPQQKDPSPATRPVPGQGSWWVRFWAWVARLLGLRPRGGGALTAGGSGDIDCPRPDFTQRLTTTWTRFLHDRMPWLLGHPIFFGRPFPWQWGDWRLPHSPVLSASMTGLGVTAARLSAGLPTVGSLLHEVLPGTQQPQTSAEGGKVSVVRRRYKRGGSATMAGGLGGVSSESRAVGLEVDLGARHWPMQNIHIRLDGSPSSMLVPERPSSALLQPVALTSPSPLILDATARKSQMAAVPRASSRLRPQPVEADAPLLIWPEEDHPNHEGDDHVSPSRPPPASPASSPSVDDEADPRHYPEDPEEPGVVSLFTSFFPQDHANRTTPASQGPTDVRGPSPRPAAPPSSSVPGAAQAGPTLPQPELAATSPRIVTLQNTSVGAGRGTYREGSAMSASLLEDDDEEEVAAAMLQGQNETSAYGRILADLSSTEPMAVTEDVSDAVLFDGLEGLHMPWAASAASLEDLDKRMVIVAVESARMVTSKAQLWRFIGEIGLSPLLAGLQKSLERQEDTQREEADLLRTQAVEALLNLMNTAMDLQVVRVAVEGRALLGRDVVSNLIDVVEAPLLLLLPKIIKPRNEEVLYRGQRAAVEVLFQTVLASDKAIQLIQEDGRLWNALVQITAEGMYPPGSSIYVTSHKLLAAIGHNEWRPKLPGQRGLRILSFDGGGTRGVLSIALLKQVMESVGKEVFETFDIICGTSTGGILAVLFGIEQNTIADAEQLYDKLVSKIFSSNPILQTTKLLVRQSYYDEGVWENVLRDMLGDMLMVDSMGRGPGSPRVFCASLSLKSNPASLWLWRNYNYAPDQKPKHGGSFRIRVRDALRATTAAPTFFSPLETEDAKYCDGAFLANNPTAVALNEARLLYPGVPVEVVVSIGTGYHKDERKADVYGWEGIVNDLINCATNTEVTHETLSVFLPKSKYFRFNPRTENFPLDEIRPERLQRMKRIAREYFWDKENKERLHALAELLRKGSGPTMPTFRSSILQYTDSRP